MNHKYLNNSFSFDSFPSSSLPALFLSACYLCLSPLIPGFYHALLLFSLSQLSFISFSLLCFHSLLLPSSSHSSLPFPHLSSIISSTSTFFIPLLSSTTSSLTFSKHFSFPFYFPRSLFLSYATQCWIPVHYFIWLSHHVFLVTLVVQPLSHPPCCSSIHVCCLLLVFSVPGNLMCQISRVH